MLKPCWSYKWVANSNSHISHWIHWISIDIISSPSLPQAHHIGWMSYGAGALMFFGGTFSWTAKWTSHKPWWNASQRIIVVPLAFTGFVEIFGRWTATMTDTRTRTALREDFSNSGPSCACFFCFSNFVRGWYHLECWAQKSIYQVVWFFRKNFVSRFVCVQSWLGRRDAGRCRDGGRLQWRGQGVPH